MSVGSVTASTGLAAITLGARQKLKAMTLQEVMWTTGTLQEYQKASLEAVDDAADGLIRAGITIAQNELLGLLIDARA